jgi:pimeloyl-ACP methyl ester carboxylesterase
MTFLISIYPFLLKKKEMNTINYNSAVTYGFVSIDDINIFYREAGDPAHPKLVLLHGFPSSSHQYRNLLPVLAESFHVIAPDYPGFGLSDIPDPSVFDYSFDMISEKIERFLDAKGFTFYGLYAQDYGGPVGFRITGRRPESLQWLIIQNSNAYEVGFTAAWDGFRHALWKDRSAANEEPLAAFLELDVIKKIYLFGAQDGATISPDNWESDNAFMQRPNAKRVNLDLFYDYRKNVGLYGEWQQFLRTQQPKTIIFWGQQDIFFTPEGGEAFLADLPDAEMHRLAAGHFAVEGHLEFISAEIKRFYKDKVLENS